MKRKIPILALLAAVLVFGASVNSAWSYFTDSATAEGGLSLSLKPTSTIFEKNESGKKTVRIDNTSDVAAEWVRVYVYANEELGVKVNVDNTKWELAADGTKDVGWYVFKNPVYAQNSTDDLIVTYDLQSKDDDDEGTGMPVVNDGDEANVIIIYEVVPVTYGVDGKTEDANWNA